MDRGGRRLGGRGVAVVLTALVLLAAAVALGLTSGTAGGDAGGVAARTGPFAADFTGIRDVPASPAPPAPQRGAATGTVTEECGRNDENHRNADNLVVSPGLASGAHHTHDYVGNLSTNAFSTNGSLAAARTTCADGDRSSYYWPVLRRQDQPGADSRGQGGGLHGNIGRILRPVSVTVEFRGSPASHVIAMPRFLRMIVGDPVAGTEGLANARAQWGCSAYPDRHTIFYPRCPDGSLLTRTLDFPSCWNGLDTDSPNHRTQVLFATADGSCPNGTFPVPQLRLALSYDVPGDAPIAVDAFSEQRHSPRTDHAGFVNVMTDRQMNNVVRCLNEGRHCRTV